MKITYGITVCDEADELYRLLNHLQNLIDVEDEILILRDLDKTNSDVSQTINEFKSKYNKDQIKEIDSHLRGDFASFKNKLVEHATGEYLFQLDADEIPSEFLIENIKPILNINKNIDVLYIPRVNKVSGLTDKHIERWRWHVDEEHRINYPDLQMRIFKLGKNIRWKNKVHEVLENFTTVSTLPYEETEDFCLHHYKTIKKQEQQNQFYETL